MMGIVRINCSFMHKWLIYSSCINNILTSDAINLSMKIFFKCHVWKKKKKKIFYLLDDLPIFDSFVHICIFITNIMISYRMM